MAEQSLWQRLVSTITREYERRIRRASLVTEYGASHHGHHAGHADDHTTSHTHDDEGADDEGAAIVNVPKGTRLGRRSSAGASAEHEAPPYQG